MITVKKYRGYYFIYESGNIAAQLSKFNDIKPLAEELQKLFGGEIEYDLDGDDAEFKLPDTLQHPLYNDANPG